MVNLFRILFSLLIFFISHSLIAVEPQVHLKLSKNNVWQRQQVLISLDVVTDDPFARLDSQEFALKGFTVIPFKQQRTTVKNETILSMKWAVFPFVVGDYHLELPRIRYRPNSGRPEKLTLPTLPIKVRRLPIYVPPTMPVGEIELESSWNNGLWVSTKQLLDWNIKVIANNVVKQTLPPLSRQLKTTESLQIFPMQQTSQTQQSDQGIINQQLYKIPLKALSSGKLELPNIQIQYFEPESGKLQKASIKPPFVIALRYWMQWFLVLLLVALLKITPKLNSIHRKFLNRQQALQALKQAENYQQIRSAINRFSITKNWEENITLSEFVQHWEKENSNDTRLRTLLESLKAQQFSANENQNNSIEIKQIREDLFKLLR